MSRNLLFLGLNLAVAGGLVLIFAVHVSLSTVLSVGMGALCLLWLVLLLTVPWNVYFQARELIREIQTSREQGLEVPPGRDEEARRIAVRMRAAAIGAHLLSAAILTVITYFSGATVGYYFVGFYLVSTVFRPTGAWFAHLRGRLSTMLNEVRYPRDDVLDLKQRVTALEHRADTADEGARRLGEEDRELRDLVKGCELRDHELDRRLDAVGRQFEDTISRLTDNQEVIAGIKAFLRLLRTEPT
jgi:hypothetical protein